MTWQEQAKALFFIEKKTIKEVSQDIYKSERSIRQYLKTLPQYKKEREKEKQKTEKREKPIKDSGTEKTEKIVITE